VAARLVEPLHQEDVPIQNFRLAVDVRDGFRRLRVEQQHLHARVVRVAHDAVDVGARRREDVHGAAS